MPATKNKKQSKNKKQDLQVAVKVKQESTAAVNADEADINKIEPKVKVWTKEELQELVRHKTALLVAADSWTGSNSWKDYFCVQLDKEKKNEVCKYFAVCRKCALWLSVPQGTVTTLIRHSGTHTEVQTASSSTTEAEQGQIKITGYVKATNVLPLLRENVMKDTIYMIAHDSQPFSVVEDNGFRKLAQTLIATGAKYGNLDINTVLYDRTSLSKTHLPAIFKSTVEALKKKLAPIQCIAVTTDHWTDDMIKNSYQAFTIHYITEDFQLETTCLGVYEFTESKTAAAIKAKTTEIIRATLPSQLLPSNITFVTDNAANIKAAYKNDLRISCAGHNVNLLVTNGLKLACAAPVCELINTSKSVVGYFKHSGHNKDLEHTLKQDVSTRWNSQFFMLQSLFTEMNSVITILENEKQYEKLESLQNIDKQLLQDVIAFLHSFHSATVSLSLDTKPTFHRVWPTLHRLLDACSVDPNDSEAMSELKAGFKTILLDKFSIHPLHKLSTVLCPALRQLSFVKSEERDAAYRELRQQIDLQTTGAQATQPQAEEQHALTPALPGTGSERAGSSSAVHSHPGPGLSNLPTKRMKLSNKIGDDDFLAKYMIVCAASPVDFDKHELDIYLELPLTSDDNEMLTFWRKHRQQLPKMAAIARKVLSIPATSTSSERVFSACGYTLNDRRARMNAETLEKLMFLKYNM